MKRPQRAWLLTAIGTSVGVVSAVCWHSVQEIHYLKSFFPRQFSVAEAYYAGALELVKVAIIALPFLLVIAVCLRLLRHFDKTP